MRRVIGLCCVILVLVSAGAARAQEVRPDFLTFLSVNDVKAMASDGTRLWLATTGGAVSYDPATHDTKVMHRMRDGLLSDSVSAVTISPDGRVWFGTERAGISIYDPQNDEWEPYTSQLRRIPGDQINRLRFAQDSLYISEKQGFTVNVGDQGIAFYLDGTSLGLPSSDVRDIARSPDGNGLWIATADGVVHRDSLEAYRNYPNIAGDPVADRIVRYRGEWLAAFGNELRTLRLPDGVWVELSQTNPLQHVWDLLVDGNVLYIAGDNGVWKYDDSGYTRLGTEIFSTLALIRGPDQILYAGALDPDDAKNGLRHFDSDHNAWPQILFPGPSARSFYRSIAFDGGGVLHAATTKPGYYQNFNGSVWSAPRALGYWAFDMLVNPAGGLWLAHCCCKPAACPLELLQGGTSILDTPGNLRDIAYDDRDNLWGASFFENDPTYAQGLWVRMASTGEWTNIKTDTQGAHLLSNVVRAVLPVGQKIWIGYAASGVQAWDLGPDRIPLTADDGTWRTYTKDGPIGLRLISDNVTTLAAQGDRVWIGTDNGLSIMQTDGIHNITASASRIPAATVNKILPLSDGGAWVATYQGGVGGLTRMAPTDVGYAYTSYGPPDLPNPDVESLAFDPDGRSVWAGTARGLTRVTPRGASGSDQFQAAVYPNPYVIGCGGGVRLFDVPGLVNGVVVDLSGRPIVRFERRGAGDVVWDGKDGNGKPVAPGLYMIRISTSAGIRGIGVGIMDGPCP